QDINEDTKLVISKFVANLLPPMTLVLPAEHQPLIDVFQKWFPTRKSRNSPLAQTIAQNFQRVVSSELCGRSCFVFNLANPSADDSFHEEGQDFLTYLDQLQGAERLEHQNETEQEQREKLFAANIPRNTSRFISGGDAYYKVINRLVYPQMFFASPLLQNEHLPLLVSDKRFAQSLDQAIAVVARQKIWRTSYEERDVNINILPFINVFHRVGKFFQEHQQPLPDFYQASVRRMLHFVERELDKYYQRLKVAEFSPASSSPPPPPETVQMVTDYLDILNDLARSMVQAQDGESLFVYYNVLSRWQHYAPAGKALIYLYQTLYPLIKDNPSFQVKHFYTEIFQASYDALPALEIDGRPDIDLRPFRMGEFLNAYPGQNFDPEIKEIYAQLMGVDLADLANENACLDRIDRYVHRVRWGLMSDFLRLDLQNNNGQGLEAIAGLVLRFYPPWTRHTTIFYEQFLSFINEIALFRHNLFILAPYAGDGNVGYFRALLADHAYRPEFLRAIWAYWKKIYHPSPEDQAALGAAAAQDGSTKVRRPLSFGQTQLLDVAERALYAIFLPETKNKFGEPLPLPIYRLTFAAYADLWREYLAFLEQEVFPFYNVDPHSPWARLVTIIGRSFAPTTSAKMNPARTEEFEEFPFDREALIGRLQEFVRSFPRNNYPVTELDPKAILAQPYLAFELVWRTQLTNPNAANLFPSFIILRLLDMSVTAYQDYLRGMGNEVAYGRIQDLEELLVQRPNAQHSLLEPAEVVALLRGITSQTYFEPSDQATEPREFVMRAKRLLFEIVRPYSTKIFMADEKNLNINIPSTIHQDELARHLDALQFRQFCNIIDPP
ncbi:MAG: hypothetical protein J6Y94_06635, partial [Bacteriovoracaceae bacterium]|nr:hypothetical protein [Bacteriovoracaceae bacterium]